MSNPNEDVKDEIKRWVALTERRLEALKGVVQSASLESEEGRSDLRIAVADAITPLSLAAETLQ